MDVGRLNSALEAITAEVTTANIGNLLDNLVSSIRAATSQTTAEASQTVAAHYEEVIRTLSTVPSNDAFPTRRKIFDEIGATRYLGNGLLAQIQAILNRINFAPQVALGELEALVGHAKQFYGVVSQARTIATSLDLEYDDLDAGEMELVISVPRTAFEPTTGNYRQLVRKLGYILDALNELAPENASQITIKKVSSTDWQFYIQCGLNVLMLLPYVVEKTLDIVNKYLDYKTKVRALKEGGFPDETIAPLRAFLENYLPTERKKIVADLLAEYEPQRDPGRKNELTVSLDVSLQYLIELKAEGTTFEVRAALPAPPAKPDEGEISPETIARYERAKEIANDVNAKGRLIYSLEVKERGAALPPPPEIPDR